MASDYDASVNLFSDTRSVASSSSSSSSSSIHGLDFEPKTSADLAKMRTAFTGKVLPLAVPARRDRLTRRRLTDWLALSLSLRAGQAHLHAVPEGSCSRLAVDRHRG